MHIGKHTYIYSQRSMQLKYFMRAIQTFTKNLNLIEKILHSTIFRKVSLSRRILLIQAKTFSTYSN